MFLVSYSMETLVNQDSPLGVFSLMFGAIYLVGYFMIFNKWMKHRLEAASCLMSLAHGTPVVLLATYSMLQSQKLSQLSFASSNNDLQNMVFDFSIAYFIMDLLHYMLFIPGEILFIAHHLATLYVLLTCRYVVCHGAVAILGVLILAEVTSPCQNSWSLTRLRKGDSLGADKVYESLSPIFFAYYSLVRIVLGPVFVYKLGVFFVSGAADHVIPKWAWISWGIVISGAIALSISWILNLWVDWYIWRTQKEPKKVN